MTPSRLSEILTRFARTEPPRPEEMEECERAFGLTLPADYKAFLSFTNGGEGFIGENSYAMLWRIQDLVPFNREYEVQVYAPGLILFGSSGGGEAFAFDTRCAMRVVSVPFIPMDLESIDPIGPTFDSFLEALYTR